MSKRETYEARTETLLQPIAEANQLIIYDIEYCKEGSDWYLRIFIDKTEGVSITDCELVSRAISALLDREDFIEEAYILEVSSPGLGRTLKKEKHLEKSLGKKVEIKTYKPIEKQKEFVGILKAYNKETVTITIEPEEDEDMASQTDTVEQIDTIEERVFARTDIALIRLAFDF